MHLPSGAVPNLWARYARRLTYDEAVALCALGSRIIYIDTGGFYTATTAPEVITGMHENGVTVFWEAKENGV